MIEYTDSEPDDSADERDLTLSERVAWTNAFERAFRREDGELVLELEVYPVEDAEDLPRPAFTKGLSHRWSRFVSGNGDS